LVPRAHDLSPALAHCSLLGPAFGQATAASSLQQAPQPNPAAADSSATVAVKSARPVPDAALADIVLDIPRTPPAQHTATTAHRRAATAQLQPDGIATNS